MGAARAWKHRFFALFLLLLLGKQKNRSEAEFGEANKKRKRFTPLSLMFLAQRRTRS